MLRDIILCLFIGYIFGCFQTGYIYGKCHGIDIRQYGSGNAGTTNTLRVLGKKAGYITYLGDALKAIIAIVLVEHLVYGRFLVPSMSFQLLLAYTGLGVAFGHNYPFYLKFKGGKGIAVTSGVMLALDLRIGLLVLSASYHLFCNPICFGRLPLYEPGLSCLRSDLYPGRGICLLSASYSGLWPGCVTAKISNDC